MAKGLLLALALAVLAAGGYYGWQRWFAPGKAQEQPLTAEARRGSLEDLVTATGTLQPLSYVDVGTQVSGQLKKLNVAIGEAVKQGDLLAEIDPTVFLARVDASRAQLRNQQAQLADKQSQLALAQIQRERQRNLIKENATTEEALQVAEASVRSIGAQIEALGAQMQQTESTLRADEANLGYTKIYAPIAGTVVSQPAKHGQTLNANQQAPIVMRVADLSTMTVQAQVSEADVTRLRPGMEVYFTILGGEGRRWNAKLRQLMPTPNVVNNVVLYDALFDVPNPTRELMTQMTAQVFFVVASVRDAVYVPVAALRPAGGAGPGAKKGGEAPGVPRNGTAVPDRSAQDRSAQDKAAPGEAARGEAALGRAGQPSGSAGDARKGGARPGAGGRALVQVLRDDGTVEDRPVRVGMTNRISAEIRAGLEPGEKVVLRARGATAVRPAAGGAPKFQPKL
ncbi:MAG: efflux RND transporter periplasmic adaptor subunit [Burkholderiales bacterium]|nr:efflux RND transporter periplasmic adaptor subunit [Burkholderiales bacterium]